MIPRVGGNANLRRLSSKTTYDIRRSINEDNRNYIWPRVGGNANLRRLSSTTAYDIRRSMNEDNRNYRWDQKVVVKKQRRIMIKNKKQKKNEFKLELETKKTYTSECMSLDLAL